MNKISITLFDEDQKMLEQLLKNYIDHAEANGFDDEDHEHYKMYEWVQGFLTTIFLKQREDL